MVAAVLAEEVAVLADDGGRAGDPLLMAGEPMRRRDEPAMPTCGLAGRLLGRLLLELKRAAATWGDRGGALGDKRQQRLAALVGNYPWYLYTWARRLANSLVCI